MWHYFVHRGNVGDLRPENRKYQLAIRLWQRLPVWRCKSARTGHRAGDSVMAAVGMASGRVIRERVQNLFGCKDFRQEHRGGAGIIP